MTYLENTINTLVARTIKLFNEDFRNVSVTCNELVEDSLAECKMSSNDIIQLSYKGKTFSYNIIDETLEEISKDFVQENILSVYDGHG